MRPASGLGRKEASKRSDRRSSSGKTLYCFASTRKAACSSHLLGMLGREVIGLGESFVTSYSSDGSASKPPGPRPPTADGHGASWPSSRPGRCHGCRHLEILDGATGPRRGMVEGIQHADAFDWLLFDAVDDLRRLDACCCQHGGRDVNDVMELGRPPSSRECLSANGRPRRCAYRQSARQPAWSTGRACLPPRPSPPARAVPSLGRRSRRTSPPAPPARVGCR